MKSIKPGRGPSMMGGVMSIIAAVFGLIWTFAATSMGGGIFALFGVVFIISALVSAVFNFKNATSQNRYSSFDIVDSEAEPDPFSARFSKTDNKTIHEADGNSSSFCPYCGTPAESDFEFCKNCGKKLP